MSPESFRAQVDALDVGDDQYATRVVDLVLALGRTEGVSDIHLLPTSQAHEVRWRLEGVLAPMAPFPSQLAANVIARLKVFTFLDRDEIERLLALGVDGIVSDFPGRMADWLESHGRS